jgi:hypothetical protein
MASHTNPFGHSVERSSQEGEKYSLERTSVSSDAPLNKDDEDVEAQLVTPAQPPPAQPLEYSTSTTKKLVFLGLYFFLSLGLTLSNKALMKKVSLVVVSARLRPMSNMLHRPSFHGFSQYYTLDQLSSDVPVCSRVDSSNCRD